MRFDRRLEGVCCCALLALMLAGPGAVGVQAAGDRDDPPAARRSSGESAGWWAAAKRGIEESEYHVAWLDAAGSPATSGCRQAPNRAHGFRTYFGEAGIKLVPRVEERDAWELGLQLVRWGRGPVRISVSGARLSSVDNRVDYERTGLREWYVNDSRGLKQGFLVLGPPQVDSGPSGGESGEPVPEAAPLALELLLSGGLSGHLTEDRQAVSFRSAAGKRVVRFGELFAFDATGRALPMHVEIASLPGGSGLRLVIDDRDAVYPVTIDPLLSTPDREWESNVTSAHLGHSVCTAGDVNGDGYGDVVVGAYGFDAGGGEQGRVFVYHGASSGLPASPSWTAENDGAAIQFGYAVATAGDVNGDGYSDVVVGAPDTGNVATGAGQAYVFHGSSTGLDADGSRPTGSPELADWSYVGFSSGMHLGESVATAGDVAGNGYSDVIVGAPNYAVPGGFPTFGAGRALVFYGGADGLALAFGWSRSGGYYNDHFGTSVGTAGDVDGDGHAEILVGAPFEEIGQSNEGVVYLYSGSSTGVSSAAPVKLELNQNSALFGTAVSTAGDLNGDGFADFLAGAPLYTSGQANEGRVNIYLGPSSGAFPWPTYAIQSNFPNAELGAAVAPAGDVNGDGYADVVLGAPAYSNGQSGEGRIYLWYGSAGGIAPGPGLTIESDSAGAAFGASVAPAGDVDGDGFADVIVGAPDFTNGQSSEGRASVFHGSPSHPATSADLTLDGEGGDFGGSVASAGDVNGDGHPDLIVGAPDYTGGGSGSYREGAVYLYHGGASGPPALWDWKIEGNQQDARLGWIVASAGDVNGDGYGDVLVTKDPNLYIAGGAPRGIYVFHGSQDGLTPAATLDDADWTGAHWHGAAAGDVNGDGYSDLIAGWGSDPAAVYHGSAAGLEDSPSWTRSEDLPLYGFAVDTVGDVNADGFSDVIVTAPDQGIDPVGYGQVWVYLGSESGIEQGPASWTMTRSPNNEPWASYGQQTAPAGDLDGDGYSDFTVGAPMRGDNGIVYIYFGSATGVDLEREVFAASCASQADLVGRSLAGAGDVNGDGFSDLIVGATYPGVPGGYAFVNFGASSFQPSCPTWSVLGDDPDGDLGRAVASAGDVNGDGFADVAVASPGIGAGRVDIFFGNDTARASFPGQRRSDDSLPIPRLGASDSGDSFRLSLTGWTPFGRGPVALEWEVEPFGTAFDGQGLDLTTWHDSGASGYEFNELLDGLSSGPLYHWRARVRYHPAAVPFASHGLWYSLVGNGREEADLRMPECVDQDDDGFGVGAVNDRCSGGAEVDCEDASADVYPGAPQICDGLNNDCGHPSWPALEETTETDDDSDGSSECAGDCDDTRDDVHPGAAQICDGLNNDCEHPSWPGLAQTNDGDDDSDGTSECAGDCDDTRDSVRPGGVQLCDGLNNDCEHPGWPALAGTNEGDDDSDGTSECAGDCDDTRDSVHPGGVQLCDGLNNDCSHPSWPGLAGTNEGDDDSDGLSECASDCDDTNGDSYPGAVEVNDGEDNQCPGDFGHSLVDEITGDAGFHNPVDPTEYSWPAQSGATAYLVASSTSPDFSSGCETLTTGSTSVNVADPPSDGLHYYLVRAVAPNSGSWGADDAGNERIFVCGNEAACDDGFDNDADGVADCLDVDCDGLTGCEHGSELSCDDALDNDADGATDCVDADCANDPACLRGEFAFVDTPADDVSDTALHDFFSSIAVAGGDYIFFETVTTAGAYAWCSAQADFYTLNYTILAPTTGSANSGNWPKWFRSATSGDVWFGPYPDSYSNLFGTACMGSPYALCVDRPLGFLFLTAQPHAKPELSGSYGATCEIFHSPNGGCGDGTWQLTIRVAATRSIACGF